MQPTASRARVRHPLLLAGVLLLAGLVGPAWALDITTATIPQLAAQMRDGTLTSEQLTAAYLKRIEAYDKQGPTINAVITLNPHALEQARRLDAERRAGKVRGPLHGIPVLLKDNFDTFDLPTSGGSQMLKDSIPPDDAFVVRKLREAGAVFLAKVNLHEFAYGGGAPNGYSSLGGQTHNPHDPTRGPSGSSGGTGAGIAAAFAQFGLGSDTAGSIRNPSSANGIAGIKPTRGLLSRDGIIPLALSFDTGGPMGRNIEDVALALGAMTGVDAADPATAASAGHAQTDYTRFLVKGSLKGARIGVMRDFFGQSARTDFVMEQAILRLQALGATVVDEVRLPEFLIEEMGPMHRMMIDVEFKAQIADYLKTLRPGFPRTLAELVAEARDPKTAYTSPWKRDSLAKMDQAPSIDDPIYQAARQQGLALTTAVIEGLFAQHRLDAMVYPSVPSPAAQIGEDRAPGGGARRLGPAMLANQTGFPDVIVPAGMTPDGLPVTLSFFGRAWSEGRLLGYAYDFEQSAHAIVLPRYTPSLPTDVVGR
ncbi:glutamyl-tRNA amidotransferase [Pseudoxanthomonas winnipegensis]|jgi:amidase|uniref:Glutamyl-tRNA amidotransferase n=1 Tax=Pseudoxanthomonas winnipegensis TaxID=2480810 RepID=A0ABY1WEL3_9GAMM|nr:amidase family protein [Pseudoxanthomonas winnipegensis]TAA11880.1 glutamyl-tRNA amidotransferase [Pseudoxanthomonas winnipegensis]TAA19758.1 glutamyl-tRNA amidotransferase [Pseudoxanthomonas winnipegensis]TAH70735.1 glutamyl-tRNA amidotransferase [Pseudoxanthomonas winnipegensis]